MRPSLEDMVQSARYFIAADPKLGNTANYLREWASGLIGEDQLTVTTEAESLIGVLADFKIPGPRKLVDAALASSRGSADSRKGAGRTFELEELEPWHDPVNGAWLLDEFRETFSRFLALPEHGDVTLALWALYTYAYDYFDVSPLLGLTSPVMQCGKTRTLELLSLMVSRPLPTSNVTTAALFRTIDKLKPTLLIDEADTFAKRNEDLRGILNSGHRRRLAYVLRSVGEDHDARGFSTWAPKAYALIGKMPATIVDRSIIISMRRRAEHEPVDRLRLDDLEPAMKLARRRALRWVLDNEVNFARADPVTPEGLQDRTADKWRPLLAIADLAGDRWPDLARWAALSHGLPEEGGGAVQVLLLGDIKTLFDARGADRLSSQCIVKALARMEERPWPEWSSGRPMSATSLAKQLAGFGIRPKTVRIADQTPRGYLRAELEDAFVRYLPLETATLQQDTADAGACGSSGCNTDKGVSPAHAHEHPRGSRDVADVAPRSEDTLQEAIRVFDLIPIDEEGPLRQFRH